MFKDDDNLIVRCLESMRFARLAWACNSPMFLCKYLQEVWFVQLLKPDAFHHFAFAPTRLL